MRSSSLARRYAASLGGSYPLRTNAMALVSKQAKHNQAQGTLHSHPLYLLLHTRTGGYIVDIWSADKYKGTLHQLIWGEEEEDGETPRQRWIDQQTESISVILQLVNMQTRCLVSATVLFEFAPGGRVTTTQHVEPMCTAMNAPQITPSVHNFLYLSQSTLMS